MHFASIPPGEGTWCNGSDNGSLRLSEFKGKVVFLNFWATWCKPCEEEMPSMERLHQRFKDRGLVVLGISEDADGAVVTPYLKKHKLTFPVGLDPKMAVAGLYGGAPLLGESGTEAAVRQRLPEADVIHLAAHGYLHPVKGLRDVGGHHHGEGESGSVFRFAASLHSRTDRG